MLVHVSAPAAAPAAAVSGDVHTAAAGARYASLYTRLLHANELDVDLKLVATHFGYELRLNPDAETNTDPNYAGLVNAEIDRGVASFVAALELTCSSLAGLAASQSSALVHDDTMRARAHCIHQIVKVMTSPDATQELLMVKVRELEARLCVAAVERCRQESRAAMRGVQALAALAAAACTNGELAATAQTNFSSLAEACMRPPRCLIEQLRDEGLNMGVVTACIIGSRPGLHTHGVSGLQPSWGRQLDMLEHYFASNNGITAMRFRAACVAALNVLQVELARSNTAHEWCGCDLVAADAPEVASARLAARLDRVFPMPVPLHTSSPSRHMLVATSAKPEALRVVRFARMLRAAVEADCLRVGIVRGDILLMAVARALVDAERQEWEAAPLAQKECILHRLFEERDAFEARAPAVLAAETAAAATAPAAPAASSAPLLALAPAKTATSGVPLLLQRDYHTLRALLRHMPSGQGSVSMRTLVEAMCASGAYMTTYSKQAASQAVGFAVGKAVASAVKHASNDDACDIEHLTAAKGHKTGGELRFNDAGAAYMAAHLRWMLARMESGDVEYTQAWHGSRSARSKAKRIATKQLVNETSMWTE